MHEYIETNKNTFTPKEVVRFLNLKRNTEYSEVTIRKFMKNIMKWSFKRVKSRLVNVNLQRINEVRSLFAVVLSKEINLKTILINIDESSINRFVKINYSWGYKWKPIEWDNSSFTGFISWIRAICSKGSWLTLLTNQIINAENFVWFIKILNNWLNLNNNFGYNEVLIILDNWYVHKSKLTQILLKKLTYKIFYIRAYSPEFAPVEMSFSLLKRNLSESRKNKNIKLSFMQNLIKIHHSLLSLTSKIVKGMFARLFQTIKEYLAI